MNIRQSFEEVYLKYYPQLMVYGRTRTADEQLIEDTIQELFLTLWQKNRSLIFQSSLENYLYVSFRNNLIRKLKAKLIIETEQSQIQQPETTENTAIEQEKTLAIFLDQLPARQKEVLFLRYYQNKSYLEIAEMLGISYQVARNFSYRAIKTLKKRMKKTRISTALPILLHIASYLQVG